MGYDISLKDDNGKRHELIHTVSWNYNKNFENVTGAVTLRDLLDNKRSGDTVGILETAADKLGLLVDAREGDSDTRRASEIANELASFARRHPNAVWVIYT